MFNFLKFRYSDDYLTEIGDRNTTVSNTGGGANPKHAGICHLGMGKNGEKWGKWGKFKTSKFIFRENFQINYSSLLLA